MGTPGVKIQERPQSNCRGRISQVVIATVKEFNEEFNFPELRNPQQETALFGGPGVLDSLKLVSLIVDIEQRIAAEFNRSVVLADERAMSKFHSPFRTVRTLVDYIDLVLSSKR
jgi:acyl carrier protein